MMVELVGSFLSPDIVDWEEEDGKEGKESTGVDREEGIEEEGRNSMVSHSEFSIVLLHQSRTKLPHQVTFKQHPKHSLLPFWVWNSTQERRTEEEVSVEGEDEDEEEEEDEGEEEDEEDFGSFV